MGSGVWKVKPYINKANKQVTFNLPRKLMNKSLRDKLNNSPETIKKINLKFEGWEEW